MVLPCARFWMDLTIEISGAASETFHGDVLVDFQNDRNELTMEAESQTIQLFSHGRGRRERDRRVRLLRGGARLRPVLICLDDAGRIRRYDVELSLQGTRAETRARMSDYGEAPSLEPLGPDERPR